MRTGLILAALVGLSACGSSNPAADQLHDAAEQSDPAAAQVLENAADQAEESGANAGDVTQNALEQAGQAQVGSGNASGSEGAKPHEAGDTVPPPKVDSTPQK